MARELKPCGTAAAARRHYRNGEELCAECRQAVRDQKNVRAHTERDEKIAAFQDSLEDVTLPQDVSSDDVDPLAEALDSLRLVRRALHAEQTMPKDISALTRRRDELVDRISRLEVNRVKTDSASVFDEIKQRRSRRRAAM